MISIMPTCAMVAVVALFASIAPPETTINVNTTTGEAYLRLVQNGIEITNYTMHPNGVVSLSAITNPTTITLAEAHASIDSVLEFRSVAQRHKVGSHIAITAAWKEEWKFGVDGTIQVIASVGMVKVLDVTISPNGSFSYQARPAFMVERDNFNRFCDLLARIRGL